MEDFEEAMLDAEGEAAAMLAEQENREAENEKKEICHVCKKEKTPYIVFLKDDLISLLEYQQAREKGPICERCDRYYAMTGEFRMGCTCHIDGSSSSSKFEEVGEKINSEIIFPDLKRCKFSRYVMDIDGDTNWTGDGGLWIVSSAQKCSLGTHYCNGFQEDADDCPTWKEKKHSFTTRKEHDREMKRIIEERGEKLLRIYEDKIEKLSTIEIPGSCDSCNTFLHRIENKEATCKFNLGNYWLDLECAQGKSSVLNGLIPCCSCEKYEFSPKYCDLRDECNYKVEGRREQILHTLKNLLG